MAFTRGQAVHVFPKIVIAVLLFTSAACAGPDANKGGTDITGLTATNSVPSHDSSAPPVVTVPASTSPSLSSNFTGPGLTGLGVVSDDFTGYANTARLLNNVSSNIGGTGNPKTALYSDGFTDSLLTLDNTVLYNGHATMKYTQPGGTFHTPSLHAYFSPLAHIWYRVKVRFSSGFTTTGVTPNAAFAYKLLSWGWDAPDGSGRLEITNVTQYELYENVQNGPALVGGGTYLQAGTINTEWVDNGWYDYIIEVDHSQSPGVIRLWRAKDGQTPLYQGQAQETMSDGSQMPPLTNIAVGLNFNQVRAPNQNQALWWGEWEVVDGTQHPNPFGVSR